MEVNVSEIFLNSTVAESSDGNTSYYPASKFSYYSLAMDIYFYGMSLVLPFGLLGNTFSIGVFLFSSVLRRTTTAQLLICLAIADNTVLIGDLIRWLAAERHYGPTFFYFSPSLGLNIYDTSVIMCQSISFLRYAANIWSVWITVAIAVERLIAVALPLKISQISTSRRVRILVAFIFILGLGLGLFSFWSVGLTSVNGGVRCRIVDKSIYPIWNKAVVTGAILLLPNILVTVLTIVIICFLSRARYQRKSTLRISTKVKRQNTLSIAVSVETQLTIMLVTVCIATIALRTPYTVAYYEREKVWNTTSDDEMTKIRTYVALRVTELLNAVNFAINFILYCMSGSSFRKNAFKLVCPRRCSRNGAHTNLTATDEITLDDRSLPNFVKEN